MKNLLTPLAKSVLVPLGLETASSTDGAIQKKYFNSGVTTLILSNEKLVDTMKQLSLVRALVCWQKVVYGKYKNIMNIFRVKCNSALLKK